MRQLQFDRYGPAWRWKKYSYTSDCELRASYSLSRLFFPCG